MKEAVKYENIIINTTTRVTLLVIDKYVTLVTT